MPKQIDILINVRTAQFNRGIDKANQKLGMLNRTTGRILRTMSAFAALFVARALIRGIGESVQAFASFEKGLANIEILLTKERGRINEFGEAIRSLAKEFGVGTQDLLTAAFDIQSAIGDVSTSLDVLNAATRLAVAGGSDVAATTSGLITLMESYGKSLKGASDAADLMLITQEKARATIGEVGQSISRFLPVANVLGIRIEELMAVYAQLTRALGNTREASTALTMFLQKMMNPTQKLIDLAKQEWGMSIQRALATKNLAEVLRVLTSVEIEELGKLISRQRAIKAVAALTGEYSKIVGWSTEMLERQGYVQDRLAIQTSTVTVQAGQLREQWQDLMRTIGELVAETNLIPFLRDVVTELNKLLAMKETITDFFGGIRDIVLTLATGAAQLGNLLQVGREMGENFYNWLTGKEEETKAIQLEAIEVTAEKKDKEVAKDKEREEKKSFVLSKEVQKRISLVSSTIGQINSMWSNSIARMIVEQKSFSETIGVLWRELATYILSLIMRLIAQWAIFMALTGFTGRVGGGFLGGLAKAIWPFQKGGIVPGIPGRDKVPALLEPGELVVPRQEVKNFYDYSRGRDTHISMAGAFIMDDPVQVEKLYREYIRDQIRNDIRTGRDNFY